jgi:hypothetical protein
MHHTCLKTFDICVQKHKLMKNGFHTISIIKLCNGKFVMMVVMHDIQKVQLNSNLNML